MDPVSAPPGEPLVYRPLAGLAVAGFALAALFAGLVLVSAVVGLAQGAPAFLPTWMLALAAAGAILSFLGQRQVQNSEGTRAGIALTRWGLWLSVFLGLSYFAYVFFTGLAITQQADAFLREKTDSDSGFLPRLQAAGKNRQDFNRAFLLSLPLDRRGGSDPTSQEKMVADFDQTGPLGQTGMLSTFRTNDLVVALMQGGEDMGVEPLAVKDWKYEKRSYQVFRAYRITVPEAVLEVLLTVKSTEGSESGEKRTWFVDMNESGFINKMLTPLGKDLQALRSQAHTYLLNWSLKVIEGAPFAGYQSGDTRWSELIAKGDVRAHVQQKAAELFQSANPKDFLLDTSFKGGFTPWEQVDGRIRFTFPLEAGVPGMSKDHYIHLNGEMTVQTREPVKLGAVSGRPEWEIRSIYFLRAGPKSRNPMGPKK